MIRNVFFFEEYQLNYLIGTLKTPHISILNGITMGGGVGISVHGKFRIATENTLFAMPETGIGFFPDVGGTYFLPRLHNSFGTFLALTGHKLKGKAVRAAGIATHFIPSSRINEAEEAISNIKRKNEDDVNHVLNTFSEQCQWGDTEFTPELLEKINAFYSKSSVEEILELLKGDPSEFAAQQLKTLKKMSPTSLKITLQQMQRGKNLSLKEALELEYAISQNFMNGHDFFEGVRSLLVTKTNNPQWNPSNIEGVGNVDHYFNYSSDMTRLNLSDLNQKIKLNSSKL